MILTRCAALAATLATGVAGTARAQPQPGIVRFGLSVFPPTILP